MRKFTAKNLTAAVGLALGLSVSFSAAQANPACYRLAKIDGNPGATAMNLRGTGVDGLEHLRLVYTMKLTGDLIRGNKRKSPFGHGRQRVYGVDGKATNICGYRSMAMVTGSAIVTRFARQGDESFAKQDGEPFGNPNGSRIGLTIHPSWGYDYNQCGSLELDCTTSATDASPDYWACHAEYHGRLYGPFVLTESDINEDPYCSIFQDGVDRDMEPVKVD